MFASPLAILVGLLLASVEAATVAAVDEVIDAQVNRVPPSKLAVLAWAGGSMHIRQAERAIDVLSERWPGDDSDVIRAESLIRLADPASPGSRNRYVSLHRASGAPWRASCLIRHFRSARTLGLGWWTKEWPGRQRTGSAPTSSIADNYWAFSASWCTVWKTWMIQLLPIRWLQRPSPNTLPADLAKSSHQNKRT